VSSDLLQVLLGGLTIGSLYALFLLGVLIVFQVSKTINFAYGQVGMVAALGAWALYAQAGWPVPAALVAGAVAAILLNALIDVAAIRRMPSGRPGLDLVITLGLFLLLTSVMQQLVDSNSHSFVPLGSQHRVNLAGTVASVNDLVVVVVSVLVIGTAYLVLHRTALGTSLRASAEDAGIAQAAGVNVRALRTATWAVAGAIAAVVAILTASRLSVDPFYMTPVLIKAFIAGMIGGLDRFLLPLGVAVLLGIYEASAVYLLGPAAGTPAVFGLIIVVLALIPKRFVLERQEVRA
jgi:branched-chain amino acid transport system permease protein